MTHALEAALAILADARQQYVAMINALGCRLTSREHMKRTELTEDQ
jgi:hypothetical protein